MELADRLVAFAESGNQQRLRLLDGRVLQGWVMEITGESMLFTTGAGEAGHDHHLVLTDIDLDSLAYWDVSEQVWMPFHP